MYSETSELDSGILQGSPNVLLPTMKTVRGEIEEQVTQ